MKVLVIISNYNEEKEIENCINDFKNNCTIDADLLYIDNSSTDNSIRKLKDLNIDYLLHPVNTGGSQGVIKTAFIFAHYYDYDIYCHLDGDNQHNASELRKLIEPLINNQADFTIGSRYLKKEGFQSTLTRRIGITFFSWFISKVSKYKITDLTSGFRAYNRRVIEFFGKKFKHEIDGGGQMMVLASRRGLILKEIPVIMKPRVSGKSEINLLNSLKFPIYQIILTIGTLIFMHKRR